ncbi:PstS family phosphate ABC transporter substrate-binding protein [Campylobacter geochelonis]|uniref:PstS family phosphate ABC transporter substrate-binding protein n=1 Tax=Campylobacter geochelonis TaxID=1780362 RepID=UPI000770951F|nr:PstS family phosphate ABC transporter substrate-binding protein [Campylobacter geochelonis]CZE51525.1 Phosphate ABC transporter%2C periplasmic phosphate-binding protein PstS (TC 3.A.1.7.1) [Campylobacter geochelonis]
MKLVSTLAFATVLCVSLNAREQIKMAGSSTVFPFSSYVAEEFGATTSYKTPVVESLGTGGGFKAFCAGDGLDTTDISNASRPIKLSEFELCEKNGVTDISGVMIGYDGIAVAQSKDNKPINLTKEQLFLALAKEVPNEDGKLIPNPYNNWNQIDKNLENRPIVVYGPPATSGTRDSFEEQVMQSASKKFSSYGDKAGKYKTIREDGKYIPAGENDNLIVQKLVQDKNALGIFGYSFLVENPDKITGANIGGIAPNDKTIADGSYPIARSLFFYVKNSHKKDVKGLQELVDLYVSDAMIGKDGVLKTIGLVPMSDETLKRVQKAIKEDIKLTKEMVKAGTVF